MVYLMNSVKYLSECIMVRADGYDQKSFFDDGSLGERSFCRIGKGLMYAGGNIDERDIMQTEYCELCGVPLTKKARLVQVEGAKPMRVCDKCAKLGTEVPGTQRSRPVIWSPDDRSKNSISRRSAAKP